jgi:hypothetical protein
VWQPDLELPVVDGARLTVLSGSSGIPSFLGKVLKSNSWI